METFFEEIKNWLTPFSTLSTTERWQIAGGITLAIVIISLIISMLKTVLNTAVQEWVKNAINDRRDRKKKKREDKDKRNQKLHKDAIIFEGNAMRKFIYGVAGRTRIIGFKGKAGKGKGVSLALWSKQLWLKRKSDFAKRMREFKYIKKKLYAREQELEKEKLLPVSTYNVEYKYKDYKFKNAEEVMKQETKCDEREILVIPEIGSIFSIKDSTKSQTSEDEEVSWFARFLRHIGMLTILFDEQDGKGFNIAIRRFGFAMLEALDTFWNKTMLCRILTAISLFLNSISPAYLTVKLSKTFKAELFKSERIKKAIFNITPIYYSQPEIYYIRKRALRLYWFRIFAKITTFYRLEDGTKIGLKYKQSDMFETNSRSAKADYDKLFDKYGRRIASTKKEYVKKEVANA